MKPSARDKSIQLTAVCRFSPARRALKVPSTRAYPHRRSIRDMFARAAGIRTPKWISGRPTVAPDP